MIKLILYIMLSPTFLVSGRTDFLPVCAHTVGRISDFYHDICNSLLSMSVTSS